MGETLLFVIFLWKMIFQTKNFFLIFFLLPSFRPFVAKSRILKPRAAVASPRNVLETVPRVIETTFRTDPVSSRPIVNPTHAVIIIVAT